MEPLLETIGFPPETDLDVVRAALRRPGGAVFGGDRGPFARRTALGGGVEVLSTYDGLGLWPVFRRGVRMDARLSELDERPWGPFPLRAQLEVRGIDGPRRLEALAWSARAENWHTSTRAIVTASAFALDVAHCGPLGRGGHNAACGGRGWLEPEAGVDLPGTVYLAAHVTRVDELANPLTGAPFQSVELDLLGGLSVFVSPWQLAHDGLVPPRVGDWIAGSFVLVVERLKVGATLR
jgi:hypothetical protein